MHIFLLTSKSDPEITYLGVTRNMLRRHVPPCMKVYGASIRDWETTYLAEGGRELLLQCIDDLHPTAHTPIERPKCGVYRIWHPETGAVYVGASRDIVRRIREHKCYSRGHRTKGCYPLYEAIRERGGWEAWHWEILEECAPELRHSREYMHITAARDSAAELLNRRW